ncbi:type I restriction-modification system endonuclease [Fusobacterium periodonticum]
MANKSNYYPRTLRLQSWEVQDVKIEQLLSLGGIYGVKGLNDKSTDKDERVHIATVQSLIKRILYPNDEATDKLTVGEYDCIIVDEAHRGYILDRNMKEEERDFFDEKDFESKYKAVIDYFDAVKIALTATPALHTQEIFGEPVYSYSCSQAVIDGYLVDVEPPYEIITKLSEEGIHYQKGAMVKVYDVEAQKVKEREVLADELDFDIEKFNKSVITESFNREVCSALVDYINPEGPEKTLIFTASDEHADMVVRILREEYQKQAMFYMNMEMIAKMTGYVKDVDHLVKKFKNEAYPTIGVTVDLLTTGVDVPRITNLVFLRKVKSRILYHQMLGRATRKCDEIDKTSYKVFDAARNYVDMKDFSDMNPVVNNPQIDMEKLLDSYSKDVPDESKKYFIEQVIARLQRKKKRIKDLGENKFEINSKIYRKNEDIKNIDDYIEYIKNINPDDIEKEEDFLVFLDSIQNTKKDRIISEHEDEIRTVRQIYGKNEKPEDYLENFEKYIRENQDKVEALKLLKENPKLFKRKDLKELRYILDENGYKETELNSAYGKVENVNITADILSYIKKVLKGSTILDKEEKIQDIEKRIKRLKNWNPIQLKIIEKIISQLRENSYLTEEDFSSGIFKDNFGGYNKINQKLEDKLADIVSIINEEIILN